MANPRIIITLPPALKRVLENASEHRGCSQTEVIKSALYEHLRNFIEKDDEKEQTQRMIRIVPSVKREEDYVKIVDEEEKEDVQQMVRIVP